MNNPCIKCNPKKKIVVNGLLVGREKFGVNYIKFLEIYYEV